MLLHVQIYIVIPDLLSSADAATVPGLLVVTCHSPSSAFSTALQAVSRRWCTPSAVDLPTVAPKSLGATLTAFAALSSTGRHRASLPGTPWNLSQSVTANIAKALDLQFHRCLCHHIRRHSHACHMPRTTYEETPYVQLDSYIRLYSIIRKTQKQDISLHESHFYQPWPVASRRRRCTPRHRDPRPSSMALSSCHQAIPSPELLRLPRRRHHRVLLCITTSLYIRNSCDH